MNQTWRIIAKEVFWLILIFWVKNVIFWLFEVIFGHLRSFWVIFESEIPFLKSKTNMFWSFLGKNIEFSPFLFLRLHCKLKLTYFRSILGYFGSFIQVIRLYGSFIRVFQTFFKRDFGLSWILISQNLFSESKVRAFNSLIVFLSFYWHLRILWITDSTVLWDFWLKIGHFRVKMGHFWWILVQIGSESPIFGIEFGSIFS